MPTRTVDLGHGFRGSTKPGSISYQCADGNHARCTGIVGTARYVRERWDGVLLRPCGCWDCIHEPTLDDLQALADKLAADEPVQP